jgi:hypothetical protein
LSRGFRLNCTAPTRPLATHLPPRPAPCYPTLPLSSSDGNACPCRPAQGSWPLSN